jgi:hypothetical protein
LESISHEASERRDDLNENIVGERVEVFPYVHGLRSSRSMRVEINARQQRHLGALGAPQGSRRGTSGSPDWSERCRPTLTHQNEEGNIQ